MRPLSGPLVYLRMSVPAFRMRVRTPSLYPAGDGDDVGKQPCGVLSERRYQVMLEPRGASRKSLSLYGGVSHRRAVRAEQLSVAPPALVTGVIADLSPNFLLVRSAERLDFRGFRFVRVHHDHGGAVTNLRPTFTLRFLDARRSWIGLLPLGRGLPTARADGNFFYRGNELLGACGVK